MTVMTASSATVLLGKNIDKKVHYQSAYLKNRASAVYENLDPLILKSAAPRF